MPNPLLNIVERIKPVLPSKRVWLQLQREVVGLAQDYWKDGKFEGLAASHPFMWRRRKEPTVSVGGIWHAEPGEISEKMWGSGFVTPLDLQMTDLMTEPLNITKDTTLLDLSAGLGGRARKIAEKYGIETSGLEPDSAIAARGLAISVAAGQGKHAAIEPYDPSDLKVQNTYDCIIARETIYRVKNKEKFVQSIVACCKPKAHISFTDYIVNPEVSKQPAIIAWRAFEKDAHPLGLVEMAALWAKAGISISVHDDQTELYKKEIKNGLIQFSRFIATGIRPDVETKKAIAKRIATWAHRMAAIEQGMRFYRFYGER